MLLTPVSQICTNITTFYGRENIGVEIQKKIGDSLCKSSERL